MVALSRNLVDESIRPIAALKKFENNALGIQICAAAFK